MSPDRAPREVHDSVRGALSGLSGDRRATFAARLDRWWDDLVEPLSSLYPEVDALELGTSLALRAATAYSQRAEELHDLDLRRLLRPDWLQSPSMVGYAAYAERFAGDLVGVGERLPYLRELGVTYLHLMPLLQPREGDNDGGYAVADYRSVRADLGDCDDLRDLATRLRGEGVSLVLDLVLNHVAAEHEWARRARAGEQRYRDYFYAYPDRSEPDAYEATLPEVFPDFAPGNFTFDEELGSWVWTTFNSWQWDVNWSNPDVLEEYAEIVFFLANLGVEVLRLDAIAFLWKRIGTNCQNQPEVHDLTQVLRTLARLACPAVAFKAEAIVGPRDLVQYLGIGQHTGRVSDLAYHNSLMVQIWSMLAARNVVLARQALGSLPAMPPTSSWICYVRCHDDIGWAIDDGDAAAVGMNAHAHRMFLSDWYSGAMSESWAEGLVFQENPQTLDRRISGTAASLLGVGTSTRAGDGLDRFYLAHAIAYGWGGIPVIWSGDELAAHNDPDWSQEPGHAGDNRWAHRPRLDPERIATRSDARSIPGRAFGMLAHLARVRASLPQLHGSTAPEVLWGTDDGVLAVVRRHPSGVLVGLYNVTGEWRPFDMGRLLGLGLRHPVNALRDTSVTCGADGVIRLHPYAAWWVVEASV
jgi:amylosucrase